MALAVVLVGALAFGMVAVLIRWAAVEGRRKEARLVETAAPIADFQGQSYSLGDFFEPAFWKVVKDDGVQADHEVLVALLPLMRKFMGDARQSQQRIKERLPEGSWSSAAYSAQRTAEGLSVEYEDMCRAFYGRVTQLTYQMYRSRQRSENP